MQSGTLKDEGTFAPTSTVLVDGIPRPHSSWSVKRSLAGDLPAQVSAVSGTQQARGSIVWAPASSVSKAGDNPWNPQGWWPQKGAKVQIFAGDGTTQWSQFVGVIDSTSGALGEVMESQIIDNHDKLSATVSHPAMLRVMPPLVDGTEWRGAGLTSLWYIDLAMRTAGFFSTPQQEPNTVVMAPMQGGVWPLSGILATSTSFDGSNRAPINTPTPWGFGMHNGRITYNPRYTAPASDPLQLVLMVAPSHAQVCNVQMNYTTGVWVRLAARADRSVTVSVGTDAAFVEVCQLSAAQMLGATLVTVVAKGGSFSIRNDLGATASGTGSAATGTTNTVTVNAWPGAAVGGLMVTHPIEAYQEHRPSIGWAPTAVLDTSVSIDHVGTLQAARAIDNEPAVDLLAEITDSILSACWIDELGVMRWKSSSAFTAQATTETVTTTDDVLALGWEDNLLGSRSKVTVKRRSPSITSSKYRTVVLWEGSSQTLSSEDVAEIVASPGADEDWIEVGGFQRVGTSNWPPFNSRRGSFIGGYYSAADGSSITSETGLAMTITTENIGPRSVRIVHTAGVYPAGVEFNLSTSPTHADLWDRNKNLPLPRLGGGGLVTWIDVDVTPEGPFGVGPELIHEVGYWADEAISDRIALFLQAQTVNPQPTISNLELTPDPRRQLGDSILVASPKMMGAQMRALITSINTSFDADSGMSQAASVRTIFAQTLSQTYQQFNGTGQSITYENWQAATPAPPQTYQQFNADFTKSEGA